MSAGDELIDKSLLQTFVPINALTDNQLVRLLETQVIDHYAPGQYLFRQGETDNKTTYLLSGTVRLENMAESTLVKAGDLASWYPLGAHQPRQFDARAKTDVSVISFDSGFLDNILTWDQSANYVIADISNNAAYQQDREWMIRLLKSRLFYKIPPSNILQIFQRLQPVFLREGQRVVVQGEQDDKAECCYIIKEGICEVSVLAEGAVESVAVALLEAGQWFGEDALLSGRPRNATVTMATDGVLLRLDRQDFDELLREPVVKMAAVDNAKQLVTDGARWLDVRTADEFEARHLAGAINMPLNVLRLKSRLLQTTKTYIVCCDTGRRSATAAFLLTGMGFEVYMLEQGLNNAADSLHLLFA